MLTLVFRQAFEKELSRLDTKIQRQIVKKIEQLKFRPALGKKLVDYPYWSLHIGDYRIIYRINMAIQEIDIITILARKHDYKELGKF